jgi:hypothetical protein
MDWKLIIGFNDIPFLKNINKGDNCKREMLFADLAASKGVELDALEDEIELLEKYADKAEQEGDNTAVGVFYKAKWDTRIKMEKIREEVRKLRREHMAEVWKNRRLVIHYESERNHKANDFKGPK